MYNTRIFVLLSTLTIVLLASCHHGSHTAYYASPSDTLAADDSTDWLPGRHYDRNYNFMVQTDTLWLSPQTPEEVLADVPTDTMPVERNSIVAVVDYRVIAADSTDSVWLQVACSSELKGWTHESTLLKQVSPDDPISQFIDFFSDTHLLIVLLLLLVIMAAYVLRISSRGEAFLVHFKDINTFYPTLLTLLVATAAVVYATIQHFTPDIWQHYYYHPSLNPFTQPPLLALFLALFWLMVITTLAAIDDVLRLLVPSTAVLYLLGLLVVCGIVYVVFSLTTLILIGYPLLVGYATFALRRYFLHNRTHYICGHCGQRLKQKGRCPHCNAINE